MSFYIFKNDITEERVDAIVNSLGIYTTHYGGICSAIVKKANSTELENIIADKNGKIDVGDVFATPGYNLKAKNIIHVVTPHHDTDPHLYLIQSALRNVLLFAKKMKYKSIAIPLIGTGQDEYDRDEVFDLITSMAISFIDYYPQIDIFVILNSRKQPSINNDSDICHEIEYYSDLEKKTGQRTHRDIDLFIRSSVVLKESKNYKQADGFLYKKDFFDDGMLSNADNIITIEKDDERDDVVVDPNKISDVKTYIIDYLSKRFRKSETTEKYYLNRARIYIGFKTSSINYEKAKKLGIKMLSDYSSDSIPKKDTFYKIMLALRMTYNEASNFFSFFGYNFSNPKIASPLESAVIYFLQNHYYSILEIEDYLTIKYKNKVHLFK